MKKQDGENEYYILYSSAVLALLEDEDGSQTVQKLLKRAIQGEIIVIVSFVSFTEIFYITFREKWKKKLKSKLK